MGVARAKYIKKITRVEGSIGDDYTNKSGAIEMNM